ncbi:hypothetical protein ANN_12104 [Periplaneta americana]|uniref:Uncharacterized protein n=1 Tax=Periplaneta americana TaxID=6978 RepID=A0ABQ8T7M2_PERAM|nr:hypothetical protein ANN_12104 [Periplaneta americana]
MIKGSGRRFEETGCERLETEGDDQNSLAGYCETGQDPPWVVAPRIFISKVRMRRRYVFCVVTLFLICLIWLRLMLENVYFATKHGFDNFDNVTGSPDLIVPNIVHFILFGKNSLEFIPFLSILSALKVKFVNM